MKKNDPRKQAGVLRYGYSDGWQQKLSINPAGRFGPLFIYGVSVKRFFDCLWDTVGTFLLILFLAVTMFPFGLFFFSTWLFNR